jgi:multidrug efflux pump subunit AcrB
MKKIIDYFVDNSVIVNLLTILIIVMGVFSVFSLNKETFPNVDFNFITVRTIYKGAAAEDVEKLITIEVERELKEVNGVEELNGLSAEGASIVSIKVDPDYDVDDILIEVRNAVGDISQKIPSDAESPIISKATNSDRELIHFAIYGKDEWKLREDAKYIRDVLERNSAVSSIVMDGYRDEIFDIQAKTQMLEKYDVTLTQVMNAIKDRQTNITAGSIKSSTREKLVRTLVENQTVKNLEEVVIASNDIGNAVKVKDVATVSRVLEDKVREERANGEVSIFLGVKAKSSADVIKTADFLKAKMLELSQTRNFQYKEFSDMSYYVKRRLGVLSQNGVQGIILVLICLIFFMNWRVSVITAMGAPFAFLVAFALMDSFGITINLISMFGLILVLGMLVDDSIIVAEQYYQYLEQGMDPKDAAKKAAMDTLAPVSSTVITTMIAFGALFYMDGIMGKFLWPVPAVVIICLFASWIECFIILPGHLADWASKVKKAEKTRWYKKYQDLYQSSLEFALKYAKSTIAIFVALFVLSLVVAKQMRFELFPADDVTYAYLNLKGPVGSPFKNTNDLLLKIEKIVAEEIKKDEMVGYRTITGFQWSKHGNPRIGDHYGSLFIELTMQDFRDRSTDLILREVSERVKKISGDYIFSLEKIKGGPPSGKPVNVEISADSMDDLIAASERIKKELESKDEMISSEIDYEKGKRQVIVKIDESEARRLGVSNLQIAMELRNAFEGIVATTIKRSDDDVDVLVRLNKQERSVESTLSKIKVQNNQGLRIPLIRMATFVEQDGAFIIRRFERRRTFSISGEVDRLKSTSKEMNKHMKTFVTDVVKDYKGMTFLLTGENKDTDDSLASFKKALIASTFLIFIILVVQFSSLTQPLIIMSAIPFGFIGVIAAFKVFGMSIGFMALMGVLGLVGVVINDSIVLVTFINRYLRDHGFSSSSLVKASVSRFRPVILTTFTTVVGLLPIAHMPGGDPFLKPMATSFAYGLLFSTTITLVFVPTCYYLYMKVLERFNKTPNMN